MMALYAQLWNVGTFAVIWALFLLHVDGNSFMASQLMVSIPGEVSSFPLVTSTVCAMRCHQLHGVGYIYKDGTCDVYGLNQVYSSRDGRIFQRLSLPPLASLEEISRGKPAEGSLQFEDYTPNYAIDDSNITMYHSTDGIARAWWMVDLLQHWKVYAVEILPRYTELHTVGRFHNVEIRVGTTPRNGEDFSAWTLHGQYVGPYTVAQGRLTFMKSGGSSGRYLVIQKVSSDTDHLQICDVKVYAELIQ
ncbi:uncharacterized protein LOC119581293 [Penaeus monodon]|uniref:uncharacterized protein LOC119581293 n=1 Tax=Penaeus monodon TaxID=6687 RepID=UPI0018A7ADA3|nr:uncharacterized protein LOC119581293 [Penaeus monodon]